MTQDYKPKLIEVALPLAEISAASAREASIKRGKPTQLHKWFAGRPLVSCRAVLWASLVDDPSANPSRFPTESAQKKERARLFALLERLVQWESSNDTVLLDEARAEIGKCFDGDVPAVLDPFGGGAAIPLEAQRLRLTSLSGDLNPVAVILQRAMLEIPGRFRHRHPVHIDSTGQLGSTWRDAQGLAADVEHYGEWMREQATGITRHLYPPVTMDDSGSMQPFAWIWARTVQSPDPSWPGHVPLVKSWTVQNKKGKPLVWIKPEIDRESRKITFSVQQGGLPPDGTVGSSGARCLVSGTPIPFSYIREKGRSSELGQQLMAAVVSGDRERLFANVDSSQVLAADCAAPAWQPAGSLPEGGLGFRVQKYGLLTWASLFSNRQLAGLTELSNLLDAVRTKVHQDAIRSGWSDGDVLRTGGAGAIAYSEAVVTYLALAIDRVADWCNTLCRWDSRNSVNQQLFGRQAVSMVWDFCEIDPTGTAAGSFGATLKTVRSALEALPALRSDEAIRVVEQRTADARVRETGSCVVSTDPPYYDNVGYADLSDFFFVWLRRNLSDVWPDECATLLAPKADELIADPSRHGSPANARKHFEDGMARVFAEIAKVQDERAPATIFYAFKQSEAHGDGRSSTGWETFLQGLLNSGLAVTATWPIRTENRSRLRALKSNALASSIVLACRPRSAAAGMETRGGFVAALRIEMPPAVRLLQVENIAPVDLAQSAIGPGMRVFSSYSKVVEADGSTMSVRTALSLINEVLGEVLSAEEAELDADSRFALTWFEQFGHGGGLYGDADVLARAKDTSVGGVVEAGIADSRDGKVRVLSRYELGEDWIPAADNRATVWEATQHLILRLERSETDATELLRQLGGVADRARQLAYLLYGVCEKQGWAEEAIAYNGLITAWPELLRLAASTEQSDGQQTLV